MKKILLSLLAAFAFAFSANAVTWTADLSEVRADGSTSTYDQTTHVLAWTGSWSNSARIPDLTGDISRYTELTVDATITSGDSGYRLLVYQQGNSTAHQIYINQSGKLTKSLKEWGIPQDFIEKLDYIRISGNGASGSITFNEFTLTGPDIITYNPITLYPQGATNLRDLTGKNAGWASSIVYPTRFVSQGAKFGVDGGYNVATNAMNIADYDELFFVVNNVEKDNNGKGTALRVWMGINNEVETLYPYPESECETADFTKPYIINEPGIYKIIIKDYNYLYGIKSANSWAEGISAYGAVTVNYAVVKKPGEDFVPKAINGFRHFSSEKTLDFTSVNDVDAYIVSGLSEDGRVVMEKVNGVVPANTGLLLKSESDAILFSIPTCAPVETEVTNLLVAVKDAATINKAATGNNYLFNGEKWIAVTKETALAAGSSYLVAASEAAELEVFEADEVIVPDFPSVDPDKAPEGFVESPVHPENGMVEFPEDTTEDATESGAATGINGAQVAGAQIVSIVTANGAKVASLQKGLNIVTLANGKKVKVLK